jgi:GH35 family endo-1,4-beta-xylanase
MKYTFQMQLGALIAAAIGPLSMQAAPYSVCDFEDYELGTQIPLWDYWGNATTSTAVVEADPLDATNKVLHVTLKTWNTYPEFALPEALKGTGLTEQYDYLKFRCYRPTSATNDYIHVNIYQGRSLVYEDDGYPYQGDKGVWLDKVYPLTNTPDGDAATLHFGYTNNDMEYYLDDITLTGRYDDYQVLDTLKFTAGATASDYETYTQKLQIPAGRGLDVFTSRYSYWGSDLVGAGRLTVHSGGERAYLGSGDKGKTQPDWSEFTGDVEVYPYRDVVSNATFYGIVFGNGKTFYPDDLEGSISGGKTINVLEQNRVTLHDGAAFACESGTHAVRIGRLETEAGSRLYGYYKNNNTTAKIYYLVGNNNEDATLAGQIAPIEKNGTPYNAMTVGLIKEGTGTYRLTHNENLLTGALRIVEGCVLVDNDAEAARIGKLRGAIGTPASASTVGVYVFKQATLGGTGHIAAVTDLYGTLAPGDEGIGTLRLADYVTGQPISLQLRPTARLRMEIASATEYDRLEVSGNLDYYNVTQDFATSTQMPRLRIVLTEGAQLAVGDSFTLITAAGRTSSTETDWQFEVLYPKAYTWEVEEETTDEGVRIVARVTDLAYGGQADGQSEQDDADEETATTGIEGRTYDTSDATPLRTYADAIGKQIGVAASSWRFNVSSDADARTSVVGGQFNVLVAENEMKAAYLQPERGTFTFDDADRVVQLAERQGMAVRGHTLAWHSQVPTWLTSDGKKNSNNFSRAELLDLLRAHIEAVVGHYKGRVAEWDVVNECLDDNQSSIRSNPDGYDLRPSVWATGIGADFIDSAFVYAHRVDPEAKLYLNDYGVELKGSGKCEALYNLAKRLKQSGVPIDGVGLQCHLTVGELDSLKLVENIARYADLGLNCIITELDIALNDTSDPEEVRRQAAEYEIVTRIMTEQPNCPRLLIWGVTDDQSWRANQPLLYDADVQPKQAYYGVQQALRVAVQQASALERPSIEGAQVVHTEWFSLLGMPLSQAAPGVCLRRTTRADGSVSVTPVWTE